MARTKGIVGTSVPITRTIEYKNYSIIKTDDKMFVLKGTRKIRVRNKVHAMQIIDDFAEQTEKEEFNRGGFTKNPPESCPHKVKFEKGGNVWIENIVCAFTCKDISCEGYERLMSGQKERIEALNYHAVARKCPYCEKPVSGSSDSRFITFECETIQDRKTNQFERKCGRRRTK